MGNRRRSYNPELFSERLKQLRIEKNVSQLKLASLLELGRTMISNYEQGLRQPDYGTLTKFTAYFDVSADYLLGISDKKNPNSSDIKAPALESQVFSSNSSTYNAKANDNNLQAVVQIATTLSKQSLSDLYLFATWLKSKD